MESSGSVWGEEEPCIGKTGLGLTQFTSDLRRILKGWNSIKISELFLLYPLLAPLRTKYVDQQRKMGSPEYSLGTL